MWLGIPASAEVFICYVNMQASPRKILANINLLLFNQCCHFYPPKQDARDFVRAQPDLTWIPYFIVSLSDYVAFWIFHTLGEATPNMLHSLGFMVLGEAIKPATPETHRTILSLASWQHTGCVYWTSWVTDNICEGVCSSRRLPKSLHYEYRRTKFIRHSKPVIRSVSWFASKNALSQMVVRV